MAYRDGLPALLQPTDLHDAIWGIFGAVYGGAVIVTSGLGWVHAEGGPIEEIRPGDVVWFPPGLKHWHGATPTTAMTHIAITEFQDGKNVDWLEKVSDEQYRR